ncbi:Tobamovirus multiplication protein 1 [Vitis vinifera]|uniref:Tobamovirus multiplication protein 1 n=1 Tax=Vitis vinifera TaxID=29760 RepID=A0A438FDP4_VITVI|nr:Tobamovirus multiplication protein 1 [Vitis vinifera]
MVQLFRIQFRVPEYGWTTQKVFHLMNFIVNGCKGCLSSVLLFEGNPLGFYRSVFLIKSKALEMVLLDLPGLLFFSTYTLLVLFWAEIYHQARSLPIDKLRPAYYIINGLVYFTQVGRKQYFVTQFSYEFVMMIDIYWISIRLSQSPIAIEVAKLFFSGDVIMIILVESNSVILCCSGFLIYGGR